VFRLSVLFNEPKLLKLPYVPAAICTNGLTFSALQRAEIAEIRNTRRCGTHAQLLSVLFNEPKLLKFPHAHLLQRLQVPFSALQRAEIAEISRSSRCSLRPTALSVLFNEPKLLKLPPTVVSLFIGCIFQCSSTSRNC